MDERTSLREQHSMPKALLLIDIQNDYFHGGEMELAGMEQASSLAAELLNEFRESGNPLVHVRHVFADPAAQFFRAGTPGIEIHESVSPVGDESVVTKANVNAFLETELKTLLDGQGVDELLIAGAMSHMCIEGTSRAASDLGYKCQVVHDACATRDQVFNGQVVSAADVHNTAMSALSFAYAEVLSLDEWRKPNR